MSESVAVVRVNDYYGGDVTVLVGEINNWGGSDVLIQWDAWGGHGRVMVAFDAGEARQLAEALVAAAARMDALPHG